RMITFFFKTYGCQANVADSESVAKILKALGCDDVTHEEAADLIVINTCAVRDKAERKLFSYIGRLAALRQKKPYLNIGVMGCVASYKRDEIYKRFDCVNFVHGARDDIKLLQAFLSDLVVKLETKKQLFQQDPDQKIFSGGQAGDLRERVQRSRLLEKIPTLLSRPKEMQSIQPFKRNREVNRSFINIMTGCNKYCDYCIVPFTRGREVSFPASQILDRFAYDIAHGAKEVTLVGQNVNSYKDPEKGIGFAELLEQTAQLPGDFWIRWISPHPQDMTQKLFDVIAKYQDRIPDYIHFPVQSGSNRILELMKRNYTIEYYLEQIEWLRSRMPDATISTDIIVGFPGETDFDYQQTRDLVEKVQFDFIYSFIYSQRRYTGASQKTDDCPKELKAQRLEDLQKRQHEISLDRNRRHIGTKMKTLVEKRLANGKLLARTTGSIRVLFDGSDDKIGTFVDLEMYDAAPQHLLAKLVT
ncbi:MAG: MiaB/RimO family radical SAM methylthiotransferase, partial [bacterium]